MDILAALKREESKFEKQAEEARRQLDTVRAAMKILQGGATRGAKTHRPKKRTMSAEARAKISKASKARWAKIRAAKKQKTSTSNVRPALSGKQLSQQIKIAAKREKRRV
ncbi:MAG: hypothetical protein ACRD4X_11485 [Candidatus Acidiferrales bacterium]